MVPSHHSRRVLGSLILVAVAACDRQDQPTAPTLGARNQSAVVQPDQPFYYYFSSKFGIAPDPTEIIVQGITETQDVVADARAVAARLGVGLRDGGPLPQAARHRLLRLPAGTSLAAAARVRDSLRISERFSFVAHRYTTVDGNTNFTPLNRLMIQFKRGVRSQQVDRLVAAIGSTVIRPPRPDSGFFYYVISYPRDSAEFWRVAADLYVNPLVDWSNPDRIGAFRLSSTPTDPYYQYQFNLHNTLMLNGVPVDLDVERAWDLSLGANVAVGEMDDGLDINQSDLMHLFAGAQSWDLMGAFSTGDGAWNPYCNDTHGTSVAGLYGAGQNDGIGTTGVAPQVIHKLVRAFRRSYFCPSDPNPPQAASNMQIADGLNWLWQYANADVMTNSWNSCGGGVDQGIANAIHNAVTMGRNGLGTPVIFSAGNPSQRSQGSIQGVCFPATLTDVISVSAIDSSGVVADYAPSGNIDVVAVSGHLTGACLGSITTTDLQGSPGCSDGPTPGVADLSYTHTFSGTSAAAPQVAGIAALILSRFPSLTAAQVKTRIRNGAVPWGDANTFGTGKASAFGAVQ
jgi:subtilisin family serine protease